MTHAQTLPTQSPKGLVLSRKVSEEIIIGDNITVKVIEIRGDKVRLLVDAPRDMNVNRREIAEKIAKDGHRDKLNQALHAQSERHSAALDSAIVPVESPGESQELL